MMCIAYYVHVCTRVAIPYLKHNNTCLFCFSAIGVSYEERRYNVIESGEVTFSVCVITEDNEPSLRPFILNSATVDGTAS